MLTFNDIEFEPSRAKGFHIHPKGFRRAMCFFAGEAETFSAIRTDISMQDEATLPTTVRDLAGLFANNFSEHRRLRAERKYLTPLGLNLNDFFNAVCASSEDKFAATIVDLRNMQIDLEILLAGFDDYGPHIYLIRDPGVALCLDDIGFAAIGIGSEIAQSDFRKDGYTSKWSFDRALLKAYLAKHAGESAPGVGNKTDLFFLEDGRSEWVWMNDESKLSKLIRRAGDDKKKADDRTWNRIYQSHIKRLREIKS